MSVSVYQEKIKKQRERNQYRTSPSSLNQFSVLYKISLSQSLSLRFRTGKTHIQKKPSKSENQIERQSKERVTVQ